MRRHLRRTLIGVLAAGLLATSAVNAQAEQQPGKVEPALAAQLDAGQSGFWVRFARQPELKSAARITDWKARGEAVVSALRTKADSDQAGVTKLLREAKADYVSLYIDNSIYVRNGSRELAAKLAADPEVVSLRAPKTYTVPKDEIVSKDAAKTQLAAGPELGVKAIHADQVWNRYQATGQGIVIGSIDTGAQYDHPALVSSYRGTNGDGTFTHDYNWYDPARVCATEAPCDNVGHGSHTTGTMVGDDHNGRQIGVAPGARWISAKGCETDQVCTDVALGLSAQWMLAPTKLDGSDPDPSKRPNIINNSWGSPVSNSWYQEYVRQWVAAGIFTTYAVGNAGSGCATAGSPGDYPEAYAVGAVDPQGAIASFSSRGNPTRDDIKPNIVAPGILVTSSLPGDRYGIINGSSMAAPHVSGAVALLWSAAPQLIGDLAATRALLDRTARDHDDTSCGGTAGDNNVYGEGMLDIYEAVSDAPRPNAGLLTGTVTDSVGAPVSGARLSAPNSNVVTTGPDGRYELYLDAGDHDVSVQTFGYDTQHFATHIDARSTTTKDFQLVTTPRATLSGLVRDGSGHGWPLYAKLTIDGVPGQWYTNPATGRYTLDMPVGTTHKLTVQPVYGGYTTTPVEVQLTDDLVKDISIPIDQRSCSAPGYDPQCQKVRGGLIQGVVKDANTGLPVNGATVTRATQSAKTITTPDDPTRPDGFYWLFAPAGTDKATAAMRSYQQQKKAVTVQTDWVRTLNFSLKAGRLKVTEPDVSATLQLGTTAQRTLTITNDGTAPASYSLSDVQRSFELQGGSTAGFAGTSSATPVRRVPVQPVAGPVTRVEAARTDAAAQPAAEWWLPIANQPLAREDIATATHDGLLYAAGGAVSDPASGTVIVPVSFVYDPATLAWRQIADMPEGRQRPSAGFVGDKLYVVGGWAGETHQVAAKTLVYDPASDRWTSGADNPKPWAASGSAVLDGKVYSVGGCAGECQVATADVTAYDAAHNSFQVLAPYPEPISWPSCGGLDGKVYCAGGLTVNEAGTRPKSTMHSYSYDLQTNSWSRVTDLPVELWASAYAVANGKLAISGGVVGPDSTQLTNESFEYDATTDTWTKLPNSSTPMYRGAGACGMYRVGGLEDSRIVASAEQLSGHGNCETAGSDAPWLSETAASGTLAPNGSVTVTLTVDSTQVTQPGVYRSDVSVREDTPYAVSPVAVTMNAQAPASWARVSGTVTGQTCDGATAALPGATIAIDRRTDSWTLATANDGSYALWVPGAAAKARVVVAADGYRPASVDVALQKGANVLLPFTLRPLYC
ncbi:S8 family serine peptidase [Kribbella sp. NPDC050241]|uniref:S8 family serine peptidase n=1 Tax=Kribbella sp. NPDC050241 TaxID=3364115 RepID=UPI0037BC13F5